MSAIATDADREYGKLLAEYRPRSIHDEVENARAIAVLEALHAKRELTRAEEHLSDLFTALIRQYEDECYALPAASPREKLAELMAANDLKNRDLAEVVGSKGVLSEILSGRREISRNVAQRLAERFGVPHTLFL